MLRSLREYVKRLPFFGPKIYQLYLKMFCNEGEVFLISNGLKMIRFMNSYQPQYRDGTYEPFIAESIERALKLGDTFYDVGANAGYFSLIAAQKVGPKGCVVAFEPHPITAETIRKQFLLNELQNCTVVEAAVSSRKGTARLSDDLYSVMQFLVDAGSDYTSNLSSKRYLEVPTVALSDFARTFGKPPDVIKIDIEGAEILALQGAREILEKAAPTLLVELHSDKIKDEYFKMMTEIGYTTEFIVGSAEKSDYESRFVISEKL